jgi:hypothetical protein
MTVFKEGDLVEVTCAPYDIPIEVIHQGIIVGVHDAIGHSQEPAYDVLVDGDRRTYRDTHIKLLRAGHR